MYHQNLYSILSLSHNQNFKYTFQASQTISQRQNFPPIFISSIIPYTSLGKNYTPRARTVSPQFICLLLFAAIRTIYFSFQSSPLRKKPQVSKDITREKLYLAQRGNSFVSPAFFPLPDDLCIPLCAKALIRDRRPPPACRG